jgi:hypothetical protein
MNKTKKELKKMNKNELFYIAIAINTIGFTLIGLGIGIFLINIGLEFLLV